MNFQILIFHSCLPQSPTMNYPNLIDVRKTLTIKSFIYSLVFSFLRKLIFFLDLPHFWKGKKTKQLQDGLEQMPGCSCCH